MKNEDNDELIESYRLALRSADPQFLPEKMFPIPKEFEIIQMYVGIAYQQGKRDGEDSVSEQKIQMIIEEALAEIINTLDDANQKRTLN